MVIDEVLFMSSPRLNPDKQIAKLTIAKSSPTLNPTEGLDPPHVFPGSSTLNTGELPPQVTPDFDRFAVTHPWISDRRWVKSRVSQAGLGNSSKALRSMACMAGTLTRSMTLSGTNTLLWPVFGNTASRDAGLAVCRVATGG
jgi:hypothetical protein